MSVPNNNPDRHTCNACDRKFIASNPNTLDGVPVCTACLTVNVNEKE